MSTTNETSMIDSTVEQLMKLPPEQRLEIGERLLDSVPPLGMGCADKEWEEEIERRVKEFDENPSIGVPAEQVMASARRIADETV